MARIAIGIAAGHDADAHRLPGGVGRAVADRVARLQLLDRDQPAGQRHRRLQLPVGAAVFWVIGCAAVERDAAAHPVGRQPALPQRAAGVAQRGGAVAQAALARQVLRRGGEGVDLVRDAIGSESLAVGVAEMRDQRDLVDLRQRIEPDPGRSQGRRREAEPVHARIHLEEDAVRLVRLVRGQPVDLLLAVHHMPEVQARAGLEVARLEAAFEQQDRAAPVERAQPLGLGQVEQREAVGGAQRRKDALDAMPVGIGLDHGPQPGVGRGAPQSFEVVAQGRQVDGGEYRTRHGVILARRGRGPGFGVML